MPSIESPLHKILKSQREQKRFSLHSIHQETRIPVIYLEAMEAGNWKAFPAEVYLLGFLQKYAKYLGLDANEMVQIYRKEQEATITVKQEEVKKVEAVVHREQGDSLVKVAVLAALILFVAGGWLYTVLSPGAKKEKPVEASNSAAVQNPVTPPVDDTTLRLNIHARESVWVRVVSDDALQFEGFLTAASSRSYQANQSLQLRIGNVQALELTLNDRKLDPSVGSVQSVGELRLTRASLSDDSLLMKHNRREPDASANAASNGRHESPQ